MPATDITSNPGALDCVVALIVAAALLWAGAALGWHSYARTKRLSIALDAAAIGLLALGIWWPAHALTQEDVHFFSAQTQSALALVFAVMLAVGASAASNAANESASTRFSVTGLACSFGLLLHGFVAAPGASAAVAVRSAGGWGVLANLLAGPPSMDALTRLATRVHFEDQLAAHVASCDASHSRLALLFIDLDGFKPVNDTFGHSSGDQVLRQVGERVKLASRSADTPARIGGDE